jgi:serine phosphatase RsbU (regulator of sigma subunit)
MPLIAARRELRELREYRRDWQVHQEALALQQQLVLDLQQLMQPPGWSALENCGIRVAARCHSADSRLRIGGDWYLAMPVSNGDLLLAVGDVAGHGLPAVATMIRLRYAMAAFAAESGAPGEIMARLNALVCRGNAPGAEGITATAVAARFSPATGQLTWARAGHPPLLAADWHSAWKLRSPDGLMLGVTPAAVYEEEVVFLKPHSFVVLYTDGVFDLDGPAEDEGADLAFRVSAARHAPASLLDLIDYASSRDDICVLVAERVR